ncbi:MAG: hypothetical protein A2046_15405 [Bacteroidetes bacterium GWA2_30_7]|nr:MAG: hypothetical protein A2046_15405 [Bacteroidetes bacterium GWA2_30_7]
MDILFYFLIFFVAFLYSSVGHGGASGYLAIMALYGFEPFIMKPSALILNILVSAIAFIAYWRAGHFRFRLFWQFAIASFPMAFIGGMISIEPKIYKIILAIALLFALLRIVVTNYIKSDKTTVPSIYTSLITGAILGFFSGLIGIGGGIILSPLFLIFNWGNMKETAAVSALFIFVNSVSGFSSFVIYNNQLYENIYPMLILAVSGGLLGSYSGGFKLNSNVLRYFLAGVLLIASIKLLFV